MKNDKKESLKRKDDLKRALKTQRRMRGVMQKLDAIEKRLAKLEK